MKRYSLTILMASGLWALCSAGTGHALTLGIYSDPAGTNCSLSIPYPGDPVTVYVIGTFENTGTVGMAAAIFRIDGLPDGWTAAVNSDRTVGGDIFGEGGFVLLTCESPQREVLLTIDITPGSEVEDVALTLDYGESFQGCTFESPCPRLCAKYCDCGGFGCCCYCPTTVPGVINGVCQVAVERSSWGTLKIIYR